MIYALLIDDDPDMANMFGLVMEHSHKEYKVIPSGDAVFDYLEKNTPEVVIVDIFLGDSDGYQIFQQIQSRNLAPNALKVATTAYYATDIEAQIAQWGFDGFLPKPFNPTTLMAFLEILAAAKAKRLASAPPSNPPPPPPALSSDGRSTIR